jgi:hypothetical protein
MNARTHTVKVSLNDAEAARLDELRGNQGRAVALRRLLHAPPKKPEIATRVECLSILSSLAREGRTAAAIALARELRDERGHDEVGDAIDRILREHEEG